MEPRVLFEICGKSAIGIGFRFSSVCIIPLMLHAHLHIDTTLIRKTIGHRLGIWEQGSVISNVGEHSTESTFILLSCFKV